MKAPPRRTLESGPNGNKGRRNPHLKEQVNALTHLVFFPT